LKWGKGDGVVVDVEFRADTLRVGGGDKCPETATLNGEHVL